MTFTGHPTGLSSSWHLFFSFDIVNGTSVKHTTVRNKHALIKKKNPNPGKFWMKILPYIRAVPTLQELNACLSLGGRKAL